MGRGGPNGPSSLPRLRLLSSDSNRPCSLLNVSRVDSRKWVLTVAGRGLGFGGVFQGGIPAKPAGSNRAERGLFRAAEFDRRQARARQVFCLRLAQGMPPNSPQAAAHRADFSFSWTPLAWIALSMANRIRCRAYIRCPPRVLDRIASCKASMLKYLTFLKPLILKHY